METHENGSIDRRPDDDSGAGKPAAEQRREEAPTIDEPGLYALNADEPSIDEPASATPRAGPQPLESTIDVTDRPPIGPTHPLYQVGSTLGSMMVCSIVVVELLIAMLAMTVVAPLLASAVDHTEDVALPRVTGWLVSVPPTLTFVLMVMLIVALVVKEWLMANKWLTLLINVALLVSSFVWFPLLVTAVIKPWADVVQSAYS